MTESDKRGALLRHITTKFVNTLRSRQNGRHFASVILKCIFLNENVWILIRISLKFIRKGPSNSISALIQIMAWRRPGDKPLSGPIMVILSTHTCVTRPQGVIYVYCFWVWSYGDWIDRNLFQQLICWTINCLYPLSSKILCQSCFARKVNRTPTSLVFRCVSC